MPTLAEAQGLLVTVNEWASVASYAVAWMYAPASLLPAWLAMVSGGPSRYAHNTTTSRGFAAAGANRAAGKPTMSTCDAGTITMDSEYLACTSPPPMVRARTA
jgi:hypothetical protein